MGANIGVKGLSQRGNIGDNMRVKGLKPMACPLIHRGKP